jgi:DNA primase
MSLSSPSGSTDAVDQVRAHVNLVEVVRQHVMLRKQGREHIGLCPFHEEKTPSFSVNEQKQSWYCFGCQRGGDVFTFVEQIEKVDFRGALEQLAEFAGIQLPERTPGDRGRAELKRRLLDLNALAARYYEYVLQQTEPGEPGRRLLADRQVGEETAARFGIGFAPGGSNFATYLRRRGHSQADAQQAGLVRRDGSDFFQQRLMIPIRDERGRTVAFTGRTVQPDEVRKYVNTSETPVHVKARVLFALDVARSAIESEGFAVLVEGQFDAVTAHQFGVRNAIAASGTALTPEQIGLLRRFTDELVLVFDNDRAGRNAIERAVKLALDAGVRTRVVRLPEGVKDPDEFFRGGGNWEQALANAREGMEQRMRDGVEGLRLNRPEEFAAGLRNVQRVLDDVPDPALWESYKERAKLVLDVHPRQEPFRRPADRAQDRPQRAASKPQQPAGVPDRLAAPQAGNKKTSGLRFLLEVLVACPEAVESVRGILDPDDLADDDDRAAYVRMVEALTQAGASGLDGELAKFPVDEQNLVRRAWASPPPEVSETMAVGVAQKVRRDALTRRRLALIRELEDAEQRRDLDRIAALQAELSRLSGRD